MTKLDRHADERVSRWVARSRSCWCTSLCFAVILTGITTTAVVLFVVIYCGTGCSSSPPVPPLLLAQSVQAEPLLAVRVGVRRPRRPRRRASCGGRPPPRTTTGSRTRRTTSTRRARASGGATSAGSSADKYKRHRLRPRSRTSRSTPSCAGSTSTTWSPPVHARRRVPRDRRMERTRHRLLLVHRAALARHVPRQLGRARVRPSPLRDDRHQPQLAPHRARSPWARAGTTTTTTTRRRPTRASTGGRSTSPTTCSR